MKRRKAFATAGAVTATGVAAVVALGANLGLFGLTGNTGGPGDFKLVDSKPTPRAEVTRVVDVPVPVTVGGAPSAGSAGGGTSVLGAEPAPQTAIPVPPAPEPEEPDHAEDPEDPEDPEDVDEPDHVDEPEPAEPPEAPEPAEPDEDD